MRMPDDLSEAFASRHIGLSEDDENKMLAELGVATRADLIAQTVPATIRLVGTLALPTALTEPEALALLRAKAARNQVFTSLIGLGYSNTITPPVIARNVFENPAWYTAYTPYQPEISQGRLEALLNFQTMVADLTAMDLANASLLDEATAAAEAMTMSRRLSRHAGRVFFVDAGCHPQTIAVIETRAEPIGIDVVVGDPSVDLDVDQTFGVLLALPASTGALSDWTAMIERVHAAGGLATVVVDLLALALIAPPGEMGADIVVGSSQRFGVPLGFGGPHAAFMATRHAHARALPGRLVGVSTDDAGRPALRLALQTREQHIRREKATSNICTAQVLLAVMAGFYAVWHGPEGLRRIARRVHRLTSILAAGIKAGGLQLMHDSWFDTVAVRTPGRAREICADARARNINLRLINDDTVGISLDETTTLSVVQDVCAAFGVAASVEDLVEEGIPTGLPRSGEILVHPVFRRYHSEHEMLRYLRRLADRDLALDRTMIPLGSCTMKLNATSEMIPVTWPELAAIHPFAPIDQVGGYLEMIHELEAALLEITGYDAVSLQPNAGSQGELAGLLAIRAYHRARGDDERTVCLIPSSAHGTNAASAVMAGMRVVVVACDERGNIDLDDLRRLVGEHGDRLAACMVTYPSTHGVFEAGITELCEIVHAAGGQVYVDGANLNALVGIAKPGWFGADVSHLNLHKTFCIPHGGGGPGVGPVAAKAHLAPFLPSHPLRPEAGPATGAVVGPVAAAPWGSAGILAIPWVYITLMGPDGLTAATEAAILNANYVAHRLNPHFPVLYTGERGRVAHECIIDLRPITKATGVTVDDVAKRLTDYGFHAPTMSFPVAGTLMVEPTESEGKAELDRFCDAMIAIRSEIDRVASGEWTSANSPLRHAPHPAADVATDAWDRAYTRDEAVFPLSSLRTAKYWPPVGRIDAASGDRNLVCACPPIEEYAN
jgi:glycine dehydrogenase